jgi:hypothetical protein
MIGNDCMTVSHLPDSASHDHDGDHSVSVFEDGDGSSSYKACNGGLCQADRYNMLL